MRKIRAQAVFLTALFMMGCIGGFGRQFDTSYIQRIERGKTTKQDVRNNLGEPVNIHNYGNEENWTYQYIEGRGLGDIGENIMHGAGLASRTQRSDALIITFSGDFVRDYQHRRSR